LAKGHVPIHWHWLHLLLMLCILRGYVLLHVGIAILCCLPTWQLLLLVPVLLGHLWLLQ
jgi:hypothetical protein